MPKETQKVHRIRHVYLALLGLIILITLSVVNFQALPGKAASLDTTYNPALLFGENIGLDGTDGTTDTFLTNSAFRSGLQKVHTQMIRLPVRGASPTTAGIKNLNAVEQAATDIKALGMVPLVILRNPKDPTLLADDTTVVKYMNGVFNGPQDVVYYEFGNEPDSAWDTANQVDPTTYYQRWNTIIPQLRAISTNGKFGGPTLSGYSPGNYPHYLQTFLQNVTAIPDFISWHEYTCSSKDASSLCLSRIDNWTTHINGARSQMDSTIHQRLPIIISEWNFDANLTSNGAVIDNRYSDPAFVMQWTTKALQTLYDNQIFASMHFDVGGLQPLADTSGNPTTQGQVFSSMYTQFVSSTPTPTPTTSVTITPTATTTSTPTDTPTPTVTATATPSPTSTITPTPTPVGNVIAQDTFQRSDQTYWGTASDGQRWGGDANTVANFSIANNAAQVATTTSGNSYSAVLGATTSDAEVLFSGSMSGFNTSNMGAVSRWKDTNNWYKALIDGTNLILQKKVAGTLTTLAALPFAASTGTSYTIRFRTVGTTLSAKVWATSTGEPGDWMVTANDSSLTSGYSGLRFLAQNGAVVTVTSYLAQVPTTTTVTLAQDTFQRSNQTHWGTASDGQTWAGDANTATNFSIANTTGQIVAGNGIDYNANAVLGPIASNAEVVFSGSMSDFNSSNLGAVVRWKDTNNWYKALIDGTNLIIQKKVAGALTALATIPFAASTGTSYTIRFRIVGTTLSAKVWATSASEPSNWTATASDSSFSSGYCGLRIRVLNGAVATVTSFLATQAS